jgi:AraC-like DNA-binding protein
MTEKEIYDLRLKYCGLSIDFTRRYTYTRSWRKPDVLMNRNKLVFVAEGSVYILINGRTYIVKAGQVGFIPDGVIADIYVDKGITSVIYDCQFSSLIHDESMNNYINFNVVINPVTRAKTERLFETLVRINKPGNMDEVFARIGIFVELLRYLLIGMDVSIVQKEKQKGLDLTETACYISDNIMKKELVVEELAERNNISLRSFQRLFKNQFGVSCMEYISNKKLEETLKLIKHTNVSIKQISEQFLFTDAASFSRFIKKRTGLSPSEIRKDARGL